MSLLYSSKNNNHLKNTYIIIEKFNHKDFANLLLLSPTILAFLGCHTNKVHHTYPHNPTHPPLKKHLYNHNQVWWCHLSFHLFLFPIGGKIYDLI